MSASREVWRRRGLVASLGLNLFLLGLLGAQFWQGRGRAPETPQAMASLGLTGRPGETLARIAALLPPEDAAVLRGAFRARLAELVAAGGASRAALEQARRDLAAEPLDLARLRADLLAAREARQRLSPLLEAALLEAAPRLSPAGRNTLARARLLPGGH